MHNIIKDLHVPRQLNSFARSILKKLTYKNKIIDSIIYRAIRQLAYSFTLHGCIS